jgi:hypothetical protein
MFEIVTFDGSSGDFQVESVHSNLPDGKAALGTVRASGRTAFIFLSSGEHLSEEEEAKAVKELFSMNGEKVLRMASHVSSSIQKIGTTVCCGEGTRCFCVNYANGVRQCEAQYCNQNYCWWVKCEMGCGC